MCYCTEIINSALPSSLTLFVLYHPQKSSRKFENTLQIQYKAYSLCSCSVWCSPIQLLSRYPSDYILRYVIWPTLYKI